MVSGVSLPALADLALCDHQGVDLQVGEVQGHVLGVQGADEGRHHLLVTFTGSVNNSSSDKNPILDTRIFVCP